MEDILVGVVAVCLIVYRFGIFNSALFATVTTDASCGAVNTMHDSFTPLGGRAADSKSKGTDHRGC